MLFTKNTVICSNQTNFCCFDNVTERASENQYIFSHISEERFLKGASTNYSSFFAGTQNTLRRLRVLNKNF